VNKEKGWCWLFLSCTHICCWRKNIGWECNEGGSQSWKNFRMKAFIFRVCRDKRGSRRERGL